MSDDMCKIDIVSRSGRSYDAKLHISKAREFEQKFRKSLIDPSCTGYVWNDNDSATWTIPFTAIEMFKITEEKEPPPCP